MTMLYAQAQNEACYRTASGTSPALQQVQPADPMVERIQKCISEIVNVVSEAESDLNNVYVKLFGAYPADPEGKGNGALPNGADEAIQHALGYLAEIAYRVRRRAADLNGRI